MQVAVVTIGYADGLPRNFTQTGQGRGPDSRPLGPGDWTNLYGSDVCGCDRNTGRPGGYGCNYGQ